MMSNLPPNNELSLKKPNPNEEIDLAELFTILWAGKWLISAITGLAAAVSVVVALSLPNMYAASALLAPTESGGGGFSGLMKQYGGFASLAGLSLQGGSEGSRLQLGLQLMKSRSFVGDFIGRHDIVPELMAVERWDSKSGKLQFDGEIFDPTSRTWFRDPGKQKIPAPSMQDAYKEFLARLDVSQDQQTGYVTVRIEHQSPIVAAQWVTWLVEDINAAVKAQEVSEASKSIDYLSQQVARTSLADMQAMFFELIQSQTEIIMLAEVRPEYVFKTIDPAIVPEDRSSPNRRLISILGALLGWSLAVIAVLLRYYTRRKTH